MPKKCPGQMTNRSLDSEIIKCPSCGRDVEMFTDEPKRRCRCGKLVLRESMPTCAEWCPAAGLCLGEAIDPRELEKRIAKLKSDPRARQCLETIRKGLEKMQADDEAG